MFLKMLFSGFKFISRRRAIRLAELELQDKERKMYDEYLMKKLMAFYIEQRMRKLTAKRSAPLKPKLIIGLL